MDADFGRKKVRAPRRMKRFLRWCRRRNARFAFFAVFTLPYVLMFWGAIVSLYAIPPKVWIDTVNRILAVILAVVFIIVRVGRLERTAVRLFRPSERTDMADATTAPLCESEASDVEITQPPR